MSEKYRISTTNCQHFNAASVSFQHTTDGQKLTTTLLIVLKLSAGPYCIDNWHTINPGIQIALSVVWLIPSETICLRCGLYEKLIAGVY